MMTLDPLQFHGLNWWNLYWANPVVIADSCVSCRCDIACTRGKLRTRQSSWIPSWPSGGQSSRLGFVSPAKLKIFGAAFFRLAAWTKQNREFSLNVYDTLSGLGDIVGLKWVPVFYSGANGWQLCLWYSRCRVAGRQIHELWQGCAIFGKPIQNSIIEYHRRSFNTNWLNLQFLQTL